MRLFFLFLFAFVTSNVSLIAQTEKNQFDAQGKRHGIWEKKYPGADQLRYEGSFEHGKEVGTFKFYCETCKKVPSVVKEFNANNSIANVKYYTAKGKLVSEGKMDGKNRIGEWLYYPEKTTNIMTKEHYKAGKLDGQKVTYYPNGNVTEEINYSNGLKDGPNNYYAPNGILLKKLQYRSDKLVGPAFYYDAYGNLSIEGNYKNDKKNGLWKYYKNGKVTLQETYPKPLKKGKD
jgi:antitoxin component YwqK of YwqJK toxin-antitoxin module